MTEQTEEQIAKTKAAIDAMRNAQKNMGTALSRIDELESALKTASNTISRLKGFISPNVYQYGGSETCVKEADKAISAIAKVLG